MQESYVCGVYAAADAHNFKVHLRLKWAKFVKIGILTSIGLRVRGEYV